MRILIRVRLTFFMSNLNKVFAHKMLFAYFLLFSLRAYQIIVGSIRFYLTGCPEEVKTRRFNLVLRITSTSDLRRRILAEKKS